MAGEVVIVATAAARAEAERLAAGLAGPTRIVDPAGTHDLGEVAAIVIVWTTELLADPSAAKSLAFTLEAGAPIYHLLPPGMALSALPLAFADMEVCTPETLAARISASAVARAVPPAAPRPQSRSAGPLVSIAMVTAFVVVIGGGALWQANRDFRTPVESSEASGGGAQPTPPPSPVPTPPTTPAPVPSPEPVPVPVPEPTPVPSELPPGLPGQIIPAPPPPPPPPAEPVPTPAPQPEPPAEPQPTPTTPQPRPDLEQPSGGGSVQEGADIRLWVVAAGAALLGGLAVWAILTLARRRIARAPAAGEAVAPFGAAPPLAPNFISYNMRDRPKVSSYVSEVEKAGERCWMFDRDQGAASQWAAEIVRALRHSDRVIVFLSPRSCASPHVCRELTLADRFHKPIVPVVLEPCEPPDDVVYFLASLHELRVFEVGEETARRLLREQVATIH